VSTLKCRRLKLLISGAFLDFGHFMPVWTKSKCRRQVSTPLEAPRTRRKCCRIETLAKPHYTAAAGAP
jgi:hypothetical protein